VSDKDIEQTMTVEAPKSLEEIIVQQYMLHELKHHEDIGGESAQTATRNPVAHTVQDIYKCLHQAEFGVGHIIDEPGAFEERLLREIKRAEDPVEEPALEAISLDGTTLRLNLRPYRKLFENEEGRAAEILSRVCFESARAQRGKPDRFLNLLMKFRELNAQGAFQIGQTRFVIETKSVDRFINEALGMARRMGEIPVFSHSPEYAKLNRPSYRVVYLEMLERSPLGFLLKKRTQP
jgi:hypothetical protein